MSNHSSPQGSSLCRLNFRRGLTRALGAMAMACAVPAAADVPASAPAPQTAPADAPKLLVAIAVDQFSADLFSQYRQHYTDGLARLLTGAVFPSAYQAHAATETCPGHSTLLTGVHPARNGIVANNWYDLTQSRDDKRVYCAEDERDPNSTSKYPVVSAGHLKVPTLGERMKARWPQSRNVAVSAKDRAVMMMGGHSIDEAYWWQARGFSTLGGRSLADAALEENTQILASLRSGGPAFTAPAWCAPRTRAVDTGPLSREQAATGPVTIGTGRFPLDAAYGEEAAGDAFRVSPRVDAATLDLATRLVEAMKLGKGSAPDMLSVSLSATDYIGHAYGTEGLEMCIQMRELDRSLGKFFARLDALGIDYAVVLTADHGGLDAPERLDQQALPSATRADKGLTAGALSKAVAATIGYTGTAPLVYGESAFGDYYVSRALPDDLRAKAITRLVALLRASPQVEMAFTNAEIAAIPMPSGNPQDWTIPQRVRASYDPARTGDVYSVLRRAVVPIPEVTAGYTATHGSPWDYDRRVPLLFWRRGVAGLEQPQPVDTVDIAPSLAALIGLAVPAGEFDGRCLDIDGGPGNSCVAKAR